MNHDLKTMVAGKKKAVFSHYRDGNFFYVVTVQDKRHSLPIPIEDTKGTTFFAEFKAITLMRRIRKASPPERKDLAGITRILKGSGNYLGSGIVYTNKTTRGVGG